MVLPTFCERETVPITIPPVEWEWYRPAEAEMRAMSREMADHIQRGGLALRKVDG